MKEKTPGKNANIRITQEASKQLRISRLKHNIPTGESVNFSSKIIFLGLEAFKKQKEGGAEK